MSKPIPTKISGSGQGWDAAVDDNVVLIFEVPLAIKEYVNSGALPPAGQYDRCLAVYQDGVGGWVAALSSGGAWLTIGTRAATIPALTDSTAGTPSGTQTLVAMPNPADTPASADALRDDIVANLLPALRNNLATLATEINLLRTNMRATGLLA